MSVHYIYGEPRSVDPEGEFARFFSDRAAVVSIDMHAGHLSADPDCPCPAPRGRDIINPINEFHRAMRTAGVPVIHVHSTARASGVDDVSGARPSAWRVTFPAYVGEIPGAAQHALAGSRWTELMTEVDSRDEVVSGKKRLSAFYPTDLDFLLRQMSVSTVIFTGIMTDCCVLNSAFEASNLGYRVVVARDLTRGTDADLEAAALSMISLHIGVVADSADIEALLVRSA